VSDEIIRSGDASMSEVHALLARNYRARGAELLAEAHERRASEWRIREQTARDRAPKERP
jgi:hypothetical protein